MQSVAMFNNKGGVGKTTLLCNIASYLTIKKGKKVLVIDADPQCNTTTYVLEDEQFYDFYNDTDNFTVADIIPPLKNGEGFVSDVIATKSEHFKFDLIPGSPKLAAQEDFLASEWKDVKSSEFRGIKSTIVFCDLLRQCEEYDYVFFDMGPSLGAINRAILLACDYFITPMTADVFSILALENIGESICNWSKQYNEGLSKLEPDDLHKVQQIKESFKILFLGYVEQQYISKTSNGQTRAVKAYEEILKMIPEKLRQTVIGPINGFGINDVEYRIGSVPNFYSLIPMSQSSHKPVFELTSTDGVVGAHYKKVEDYENTIKEIVERMMSNMERVKQ